MGAYAMLYKDVKRPPFMTEYRCTGSAVNSAKKNELFSGDECVTKCKEWAE